MAFFLGGWVAASGVLLTIKLKRELKQLEEEKINWERDLQENRVTVTEEHIAEVVAMLTGGPV